MIVRLIVSAVFVLAGLLKWGDPQGLAEGIAAFHVFPAWAINPLALAVPPFEVLAGAGILWPPSRPPAALALCGLSAGFLAIYASALARGLEIHCACFGKWDVLNVTTQTGTLRALALLAACLWIYAKSRRTRAITNS